MAEVRVAPRAPSKPTDRPAGAATGRRRGRGVSRQVLLIAVVVVAAIVAFILWRVLSKPALPAGFAGGNGRLEANQVYVSAKYPGRIDQVLFNEGDDVQPGQVVARMDTSALDAQLREAEAQITAAQDSRRVALAQVNTANAQVAVKNSDYDYALKQYDRSKDLVPRGAVSQREAELDNAAMLSSKAQVTGSKAQLVGAQASATQTLAAIAAAQATADRIRSQIKDAVLLSPIQGRVETRLAEPGEVLPSGGRVFSLNDLSDVYMYIYLPAEVTGKVKVGSEARIVLDAAPQYPIRAYVAFVSPMAQFTPKTVETAEERHNLTFRVKLQIPKERLQQYAPLVKTGLPGMGYVRFTSADWPKKLQPAAQVPTNLWAPTGGTGASQ
ncbi:MAG: efflux RND transporter periplasmic adaptor subunit [Caulobacteraceae bacterium]|nr:efflux RND transporter periplasmic adaptor subunit [Caulobacteraceae bacterium]